MIYYHTTKFVSFLKISQCLVCQIRYIDSWNISNYAAPGKIFKMFIFEIIQIIVCSLCTYYMCAELCFLQPTGFTRISTISSWRTKWGSEPACVYWQKVKHKPSISWFKQTYVRRIYEGIKTPVILGTFDINVDRKTAFNNGHCIMPSMASPKYVPPPTK
jgi:hypothetical protein